MIRIRSNDETGEHDLPEAVANGAAAPAALFVRSGIRRRHPDGGQKIYCHYDEELIIRDLFQDRRNGFNLDVGCAAARKRSTTFLLEKHLDWSGIGIDAYLPLRQGELVLQAKGLRGAVRAARTER